MESSKDCEALFDDQVINILKNKNTFSIKTQRESIEAGKIYDSRAPRVDNKNYLKQHFLGWYVEFEKDHHFARPILMDIDSRKNNFCFIYILPMNEKNALIEVTYYSESVLSNGLYEKQLKEYIDINLPKKINIK